MQYFIKNNAISRIAVAIAEIDAVIGLLPSHEETPLIIPNTADQLTQESNLLDKQDLIYRHEHFFHSISTLPINYRNTLKRGIVECMSKKQRGRFY
ncbi:hypothetical protein [Nitrosomonas supralitoralis]|uniref:Uncharacterized protein n=1 Tax=Nitrosomonas supralitoralis TaxID=2116706 RepID=A0A2P7NU49_9PROT|nr:hypothetical protein [Nitrosomonas supralitoralis]PSJ16965.1 hypothetical protein C7H79_10725 [Nitrosomonas supralitoralis]